MMGFDSPVIPGFNPDPSICRVEGRYYLACSSFEYFPGVPLYVSDDLSTWSHVRNILDRPEQLEVSRAQPSQGVFAPTLRHHAGRFWMITTNGPDFGTQLLFTSEHPEGAWSDPIRISGAIGIDPDLAWTDSECYLTYSGFDPDTQDQAIYQARLDENRGVLLSEPTRIWSGTGGAHPEAPHLYYFDGFWYLLIAEGGTERGHSVTVARSRSISGPFESNPNNPILSMAGTAGKVQNTGHADLIHRPNGDWAMVFLGVRVAGSSPGFHVLGRETFAASVVWRDGWPSLTDPIPSSAGVEAETYFTSFVSEALGPEWFSPAPAGLDFVEINADAPGLTLRPRVDSPSPTFVAQRLRHQRATILARLAFSEGSAGLAVRIDPRHQYAILRSDHQVFVRATIGDLVLETEPTFVGPSDLDLRIEVAAPSRTGSPFGPDEVILSFNTVESEASIELARFDGRYLSTEVAGGFTGRVFGLIAANGPARFLSLEYIGRAAEPDPVWYSA